ncbi:MAG: hypothetical protein KGL39_07870 [Patescibacteria group bacterium]|nr:hypothetical protein [Patescibacteria group bacterium]
MKYQIHEYPRGNAPAGALRLRGGALSLWKSRDHESILGGPAETGKTFAACHLIDALLWKYPGAQGVMVRKVYNSLIGSALRTYQRVIGYPHTPIRPYGGERPTWFDYPNGSRLWVIGMDRAEKALSSERDFFYVNQAEELRLHDWEMLGTRCTGRGAVMPYTRMIGDCNPGAPGHWILHRPELKVFHSKHDDNPTLYTEDGELTEQGRRTMKVLDSLTGVRKKRLRYGLWVAAEGMVYDCFDAKIHQVRRFAIPDNWPRYLGLDFGSVNTAGVFLAAELADVRVPGLRWHEAVELRPTGRYFVYREYLAGSRTAQEHVRHLLKGEPMRPHTVGGSASEDQWRAEFSQAGLAVHQPEVKEVPVGIDRVYGALSRQPAELVVFDDLAGLIDEIASYAWKTDDAGKLTDKIENKEDFHRLDALRYIGTHLWRDAGEPDDSEPMVLGTRYQ